MADDSIYVRPDVAGFLALVNSLPEPEALIPEEQRAGYLALKAMTEADPRPLAVIKNLTCPFPAAPDDCEAAARWLAASPAELGRSVTGLATIGGSAGGNLATVTARALCDKPAAAPMLLQVLLYPNTDESQEGSMETFAEGHF